MFNVVQRATGRPKKEQTTGRAVFAAPAKSVGNAVVMYVISRENTDDVTSTTTKKQPTSCFGIFHEGSIRIFLVFGYSF